MDAHGFIFDEMYVLEILGFVISDEVFFRIVFRFAKVCVGEMIDSYILVELCDAIHMCLRTLNVGRRYMYIVFM